MPRIFYSISCHRLLRLAFIPFYRKLLFLFPLVELYTKEANLLGQWQLLGCSDIWSTNCFILF